MNVQVHWRFKPAVKVKDLQADNSCQQLYRGEIYECHFVKDIVCVSYKFQ